MATDTLVDWISPVAIHPGEMLAEELEARGMSPADLARAMCRPGRVVHDVVAGRRSIDASFAFDLESAFQGVSAGYWMNLQTEFELARERLRRAAPRA